MSIPDLSQLRLRSGVLTESFSTDRLVLWIPREQSTVHQDWDRVSGDLVGVQEISGCYIATSSLMPLRQRITTFVERFRAKFRSSDALTSWTTPQGDAAEPLGRKRTDVLLVWCHDTSEEISLDQIRDLFPENELCERLGGNLVLVVGGVEAQQTASQLHRKERLHAKEANFEELSRPDNDPAHRADHLVSMARSQGDRSKLKAALTDLGAALVRHGEAERGIECLEEALALSRELSDTESEYDVLGNLGLGYLALSRIPEAVDASQKVLDRARDTGDEFAEKMMLSQLGMAYSISADPQRALGCYRQAEDIATRLKDHRDIADISWSTAICFEELGYRDQAIEAAKRAVDTLQMLESPRAEVFAEHLEAFRRGATGLPAEPTEALTDQPPSWILGGSFGGLTSDVPGHSTSGPSLLRMAYSATRSMARFAASGFNTVSHEARRERLAACEQCERHTGIRCKLCGCFTAQKSWLPHEHCPINKWPV